MITPSPGEKWIDPTRQEVSFVKGQPPAPITMRPMGSNIRPFMLSKDVNISKSQMSNEMARADLASFMVQRVFDERLRAAFKQSTMTDIEQAREIAFLGISYFSALTTGVESPTWPDTISPPEFYELARREMVAEQEVRKIDG